MITDLPKDLMAEIALNMAPNDVLSLCRTNSRFNDVVCSSNTFWRNKFTKDFPGLKTLPGGSNTKAFYENIQTRLNSGILPSNPLSSEQDPNLLMLNEMMKNENYRILCQTNRALYNLCRDENTWRRLLSRFYSHVRGDFEEYKAKKYPNLSWREFYAQVLRTPQIVKTGFL